MKIIFLDFDGVMVPAKQSFEDYYYCGITPSKEAVTTLNRILKETEANIVVSSILRFGQDIEGLQKLMDEWGVDGKVIGKTPHLFPNVKRGDEIKDWIKTFEADEDTVDSMVILDDRTDMCEYVNCLVNTNYYVGLQEKHGDEAINLLNSTKKMAAGVDKVV